MRLANILARIDCYINFAIIAHKYSYHKPIVNNENTIEIIAGRHPVIERCLPITEKYVPNDVFLDNENTQIMLISGPNMSGKSAVLRQVALIVLLSQIGSYVPAVSAKIGIIDKLFTRIGASDNLSAGESTFMMEMSETSVIMHNISNRSLIIMDEIGRGTSTYDGISIAWSLIEYIHNKSKAKLLFATHYHELSVLETKLSRLKNYHVAVKEINNEIIFLRTLTPGHSQHSFGIQAAKLSGMPNEIIQTAYQILKNFENNQFYLNNSNNNEVNKYVNIDTQEFDRYKDVYEQIQKIIKETDINILSPIEALVKLNAIISIIESH